ncbi:MAG: hypothetical protein KDK66_07110 [Deltaproteobacteria bacterium]|nr:hypothetical protein [Deltaproteobacteria bacterium]
MKKTYFTLTVLACLFLIYFLAIPFYNDFKMGQFEASLKETDFSLNTEVLATSWDFGILWGNSNHCDAVVRVLLASDLSFGDFYQQVMAAIKLKAPFNSQPLSLELYLWQEED